MENMILAVLGLAGLGVVIIACIGVAYALGALLIVGSAPFLLLIAAIDNRITALRRWHRSGPSV